MTALVWIRWINFSLIIPITFLYLWSVAALAQDPPQKRGWNWYEDPRREEEINPIFATEPELPSFDDLKKMTPKAVGDLMEAQLAYAIVSEEVSEVAEYYQILDFVRRRSKTFTALTGVALLKNPELNARTSYPITNAGRRVRSQQVKREKSEKLIAVRGEFALVMFSSEGCGYCDIQWGVIKSFQDRTGWNVSRVDIDQYPERAARFNITGTPMTLLIRKNSPDWFPVAAGAVSLPEVTDNAYRAIRVLEGEISVQQFLSNESDDGGFFDTGAAALKAQPSSNQ